MIFSSEVSTLIVKIEQGKPTFKDYSNLISLVDRDLKNFQPHREKIQDKYRENKSFEKYPILEGFGLSFDPLTEGDKLLDYWFKYGFVISKNIISNNVSNKAIEKLLSLESDFMKEDNNGATLLSRGFFELYQDDCLLQIRQSIRLYLHHAILWNSAMLWTSFDRLGVKVPNSESAKGLNLHVDQNCLIHRDFTTIQGVVALDDCPIEKGTFIAVPGSIHLFNEYEGFIKDGYKGEYVELKNNKEINKESLFDVFNKNKQLIPIRKNNILSWDSRLTHANSDNLSNKNRYVCYVSAGLAKEDRKDLIDIRQKAFESGLGENTREAYLHASKKPRFTNKEYISSIREKEDFTPLGLCLYGLKSYKFLVKILNNKQENNHHLIVEEKNSKEESLI